MSNGSRKHILIVGGSVAGLGAACVLGQEGHRVTILERDAAPLPASPLEAFESWDRRGAPQTRHSHAFLARLHGILQRRAPQLLEQLLAHGAEELRFVDLARQALASDDLDFHDEDHAIKLLACRRITFEWALRKHMLERGDVEFRDGTEVEGLDAEGVPEGPPEVRGVHVRNADGSRERLAGDLVLDASGRRTRLAHWLEDIGAGPLEQDTEPCGIFYCSRFYRLRAGTRSPDLGGVMAADLGYLKYGIFPGDAGIFSITLCASPHDDELRRILRTRHFETAAAALPALSTWLDPEASEPISDVHAMANLENTRRWFVRDRRPMALGLFPIGDALIHTNPLNGRGCTLAWINAELVAQALEAWPNDAMEFALALDAALEREIVPWYRTTLAQDRDAIAVAKAQQRGLDPYAFQGQDGSVDTRAYMRSLVRDGLLPALREDLVLLRAFTRVFNMLESPTNLMKDPDVLQRVIAAFERRNQRAPVARGPDRAEMLEILAAIDA
jgi:2-polyprenyl-6-methoxyphenol hydroxylase-like FAD-dependent oxidoreductase